MEKNMEQFYLKDIELFHFRKFDHVTYEFGPGMNVVIGKNASEYSSNSDHPAVSVQSQQSVYVGQIH